jgi:DNA-binding response OmpR family regulator
MQGIYLAQTQEPSLILLDIMLPDMDGSEVINCLKQNPKTARIPIIAVTALAREQDRDRILHAGADDYITKPYDLYKLEDVIRRHLIQANVPSSLLE